VRLQRVLPNASFSYVGKLYQERQSIEDEDEIANARTAAELCNAGTAAAEISLIGAGTEQDAVRAAWTAMYDLWARKYPNHIINGFGSLEGGNFYSLKPWVLYEHRRFLQIDKPSADSIRDEAVAVLIWVGTNCMHAELERTVCVSDFSGAQRDALERVEVIRAETPAMLKPGSRRPRATIHQRTHSH